MRSPANTRPSDWSTSRIYWIACACLIVVAAGLRLWELSANSLWMDEARAANFTRGTFSEMWERARMSGTPLLHPVILWLVQKVESSAFSVRLVPATASTLVVAGMLLLLPRFVGRWPALQAALLYTFSTEAIRAARDAREYSIDALVAVLMIVGLLSLLRGGTGQARARGCAVLCIALFSAPLVQYGLVLFGGATLATVVLARFVPFDARSRLASPWNRTHRFPVSSLVWLFGAFAAGCCISYATVLQYQWQHAFGGRYLAHGYYGGALADPLEAAKFAAHGAWDLVASHLPLPWVPLFAVGFGFALIGLRHRFDCVVVAALLAFAAVVLAGLLAVYPLKGGRHSLYLVPILLLATTYASHLGVLAVARAAGRPWIVHATMALLAAVTVASGTFWIAAGKTYAEKQGMKSVLAALEGRVQESDAVFVARGAAAAHFYLGNLDTPPSNYYFSEREWGNLMITEAFLRYLVQTGLELSNRLYIISSHIALPDLRLLALFYEGVDVELLAEAKGNTKLHVLEAPGLVDALAAPANYSGLPGDPVIESTFDVYLTNDHRLLFVREQCRVDDIRPPFFVQAFRPFPENADDLAMSLRGAVAVLPHGLLPIPRADGVDERSFHFAEIGVMMDHTCVASVLLPSYPIDRIRPPVPDYIRPIAEVLLPSYPIDRIRVGQGRPQDPLWSGEAAMHRTNTSSRGPPAPRTPSPRPSSAGTSPTETSSGTDRPPSSPASTAGS